MTGGRSLNGRVSADPRQYQWAETAVGEGVPMAKNTAGFSLLELTVTVAIVAVLASVAYPNYTSFIHTSNRAAGQADLMALAAAMERHRAATFSYLGAAVDASDTGKPRVFSHFSPASETVANKRYDLTIHTVTAGVSYVLRARPVMGTVQAADGDLWYYSDGRKAWDSNDDGDISDSEFCWRC